MELTEIEAVVNMFWKGKHIWDEWINKNGIESQDAVLLFPDKDNKLNAKFIEYIPALRSVRGYKKMVCVVPKHNCGLIHLVQSLNEEIIMITTSDFEIDCVLKMYSLFEFSNRVYVCSFDKPDGRMGSQMLEKKYGCTQDEIIQAGIYRIV